MWLRRYRRGKETSYHGQVVFGSQPQERIAGFEHRLPTGDEIVIVATEQHNTRARRQTKPHNSAAVGPMGPGVLLSPLSSAR
jgi:hypothetical protein